MGGAQGLRAERDRVDFSECSKVREVREPVIIHVADLKRGKRCEVEGFDVVLCELEGAEGGKLGFGWQRERGNVVLVEVKVREGGEAFDAGNFGDFIAAEIKLDETVSGVVSLRNLKTAVENLQFCLAQVHILNPISPTPKLCQALKAIDPVDILELIIIRSKLPQMLARL